MKKTIWGQTREGEDISIYTLENENGMEVSFLDFGANVRSIVVPDAKGEKADVVLGYDKLEDYFENSPFYGCCVTPCGNRIGGASFTLNGTTYQLDKNDGDNNLHSGFHPLARRMWEVKEVTDNSIVFVYEKKDMDMGLPGNMTITVTYTLTEDNALRMEYRGLSDKDTLFNPTNHCYFNLSGQGNGDVLDHRVWIDATEITAVNNKMIPEGTILNIVDTPMDFTKETALGDGIGADFEQLVIGNGYDHNYILTIPEGEIPLVASAYDPKSGRKLEVYTDRPGVQLYTGNYIDTADVGKGGCHYAPRYGVCFETQFPPNAINVPTFPHPVAKAGEEVVTTTIYKFVNA
ncbi:MAG: galactose mutarotase [Lachnospiraceae bacterium]|nr:galactose mutarotase [Lachnospiraceae bacterium]